VFSSTTNVIFRCAGLAFPIDEMHGVNIVLPDMTYVRENRHKIKGMIAHGREDHIGGIAITQSSLIFRYLWPASSVGNARRQTEEAGARSH